MKKAIFTGKKSFTLLEIIVVMIIMAGGAAIAMPRIGGAIERMKAKEGEMILLAILKAERQYNMDFGAFAANMDNLDIEVRPPSYFNDPQIVLDGTSGNLRVATISRVSPNYTLEVYELGNVECTGGPAGLCQKMGY